MRVQLVPGRFERRYKRFFADVELPGGERTTAHLPNTGSMKTLDRSGAEAWLENRASPTRKLDWTLVALGVEGGGRALVDTSLPNRIVEEAILAGRIPELSGYLTLRREVRYGSRSRIDLLLEDPGCCYVEVKNVTMAAGESTPVAHDRADFPDSVTSRGRKHLQELSKLARQGTRVVMFFLLGRSDRTRVGLAEGIDPEYAREARLAAEAGVEFLAYGIRIRTNSITLAGVCPVEL